MSLNPHEEKRALNGALIGCNGVAHLHAQGHRRQKLSRLAAVCDVVAAKREEFAQTYDAVAYDDYREALKRPDIHWIDIVTHDESHAEIALAAVRAGKHVLIEKPFAMNLREADQIIAAARAAKVKVMVAQSQRFTPLHRQTKEIVRSGEIGRLVYCHMGGGCPSFFRPETWPHGLGRGKDFLLIHNGMHEFDRLIDLFGEFPVSVRAMGRQGQTGIPADEYVSVVLCFGGGGLALVEQNRIMKPARATPYQKMLMVGAQGQVEFEWPFRQGVRVETEEGVSYPNDVYLAEESVRPFAAEIEAFVSAIVNDTEPLIPMEHSREVLRAILASAESLKTGRRIEMNAFAKDI